MLTECFLPHSFNLTEASPFNLTDNNKEKEADNKSVDKNYLETDISPVITAGTRLEFQYGAEAFEAQQLEAGKEKTESNISKNISAEIGKSR